MLTVGTAGEIIERNRKRSSNAHLIVQQTWGSESVKKLLIPKLIDMYNYQMNGVDLAD